MNRKYDYITAGFYEPSLFRIHTRGTGLIQDLEKWDDSQSSTFIHEYIHFLQDITSVVGLSNIFANGEYIRYVTQSIKDKKIHVPVNPLTAGQNVDQNWKLRINTIGDAKSKVRSITGYKSTIGITLTDPNLGTIPVNRVTIDAIDDKGYPISIKFGAIQIQECMAKAIQECIYPTPHPVSPYNPYYIAKDLANIIMPGIKDKPYTLIALYDRVLQSSNPGYAFVKYLEDAVSDGKTCDTLTPEFIYSEFRVAKSKTSLSGGKAINFIDAYKQSTDLAKGVITELTGNLWILGNLTNWATSTIDKGIKIRRENPDIFVNIAKGGKLQNNEYLKQVIDYVGTPLVTNQNEKVSMKKPKGIHISIGEMVDVYAMMQLYKPFLYSGNYECPIKWYCKHRKLKCILGPSIDKFCNHEPWKKNSTFKRCKFQQWWRFKGFKGLVLENP